MSNLGNGFIEQGHEVFYATYQKSNNNIVYHIKHPVQEIISLVEKFDWLKKEKAQAVAILDMNKQLFKQIGINFRNLMPLRDPIATKSFKKILEEINPDIVHCHNIMPSLVPILESKKKGIPVILTLHGYWLVCPLSNRFQTKAMKICDQTDWSMCHKNCALGFCSLKKLMENLRNIIIEKVDKLVCVSDYVRNLHLDYGYPKDMLELIYNGVDMNLFKPIENTFDSYALHVGRLSFQKGTHLVFGIAKYIEKRIPEISVKLVGTGINKRSIGLHLNIHNLGRVDDFDLVKLYSRSLCTLAPSIWPETFGLTATEAMACGSPVIGTSVGGLPEIIMDKSTGFLINIDDPNMMIANMSQIIEELHEDENMRREMGRSARCFVQKNFNRDLMNTKYLNLFRKL